LTYGLQIGPVARIVQGSQIRLVDDKGVEVPHGEVGELLIRGPNVFAGYWNDEQATADSLRDGWYHTGDLMRRGAGDDLWFMSRKKDIIIRGGTNISPAEVEQVLASHPAVQDAAVVGVPDDVLGQRVFGFAKIANLTTPIIVAKILAFAAGQLASYKVPDGLAVIDDFPRNALSKVDRNALVKMAAEANNLRHRT
jgi:acyl-CoA synthetase (AMP-forming)/AMP-acid ligase II